MNIAFERRVGRTSRFSPAFQEPIRPAIVHIGPFCTIFFNLARRFRPSGRNASSSQPDFNDFTNVGYIGLCTENQHIGH